MLIYIEAITKQLTNHINKQSLKPTGRWDITANKPYLNRQNAVQNLFFLPKSLRIS